eukprot:CAMPEP_0185598922 /NCGR_PEP_ID=MMETSP0434-20130131/82330_1 /TAXON_ID=626734 ORGANISM="Favella taraikaensis, Strain Fe Narragansett Bay" /NCGR_SAMPLE_ID=MMETSP0434 /ASSEMBLY_ACC=CAM_ASM_000379 /LENGTH=35 /DNA_ID= /DNA_START= /DNA_END= /DNA_ORIENTATION=
MAKSNIDVAHVALNVFALEDAGAQVSFKAADFHAI